MKEKFALYCNYEIVGLFEDISGLEGNNTIQYKNNCYHRINLTNFRLNNEYLKYLKANGESLEGSSYIEILDYMGEAIGKYTFTINKKIKYSDLYKFNYGCDLEIICMLDNIIFEKELEIWEMWRKGAPTLKNQWVELDNKGRAAWLNIVLNYHTSIKRNSINPYENEQNMTYYLDGNNITSYESFFCALGEALIGPGGYYGFDELNVVDCLAGGFKACAPFKLIWKNAKVGLKSLNMEEWKKRKHRIRDNYLKLFDDYEFKAPKESFFDKIIEVLIENGVTVILEN